MLRKSLLTVFFAFCGQPVFADPGCVDAEIIGPKMITDICWSCIYPIRLAGVDLGGGSAPEGAVNRPLCSCNDNLGVPHPGVTTSMWEPATLIEFQRTPGCSSVLNGIRFPFDRMNQGTHGGGGGSVSKAEKTFLHYHYYSYPVLQMLDMFVKNNCDNAGYVDLDIMYLSEVDPTWNNDELAFFTNPEAAAVANPTAIAACATDAASSNLKKPINSMFWCAGSWGDLYPLSGNKQSTKTGSIQDTSLLKTRVLAALHRRGLTHGTMGDDAMCEAKIQATLPKTQYKFTMVHPVPETESDHVIGESVLKWGLRRKIPSVGEDPIYMIWRWNDCCNTKDAI